MKVSVWKRLTEQKGASGTDVLSTSSLTEDDSNQNRGMFDMSRKLRKPVVVDKSAQPPCRCLFTFSRSDNYRITVLNLFQSDLDISGARALPQVPSFTDLHLN